MILKVIYKEWKMKVKILVLSGLLGLLCVGAVTWVDGWYGSKGTKNMHVQRVFDSQLISAGTKVSSGWIPIGRYTYFGVSSFFPDDVGTDTITLTHNRSSNPDVSQSGTSTVYTDLVPDANGNFRDDGLSMNPNSFLNIHAEATNSDVYYTLDLIKQD